MTRSTHQTVIRYILCALIVLLLPLRASGGGSVFSQSLLENTSMASPSRGIFLVADPNILDPNFNRTVVLLLQHGSEGTLGLIINRPTELPLSTILPSVDAKELVSGRLYDGGPMNRKTLTLLYRSDFPSGETLPLFANVYATQSARVLAEQLQVLEEKKDFRLYAGYAGWGAGQLLREMGRGDWHLVKADIASLYERPSKRIWQELFKRSQVFRVRSNPIKVPAIPIQSG